MKTNKNNRKYKEVYIRGEVYRQNDQECVSDKKAF